MQLNLERFTDPVSGATTSNNRWTGVSLENRYLMLDPVSNPVGLTLYLEPTYDGDNAELEQKIILGQRHGDWKWAVNLTHATEERRHLPNHLHQDQQDLFRQHRQHHPPPETASDPTQTERPS